MADEQVLPEGQESFKLNEVCKLANVQPYMLRFWSQEFPQLEEAEKSGTGQRLFRRRQVETILEIKRLLFDEGLTIAGARKRLHQEGKPGASAAGKKKGTKKAAEAKEKKPVSKEAVSPEKVDKGAVENVQPLVAALREVRQEIAEVVAELKNE